MQVGFNPYRQNNKQNFCALNISQITKSSHEAEQFEISVSKGLVQNTAENAKDLIAAIENSTLSKKLGVSFILKRVAKNWDLIK